MSTPSPHSPHSPPPSLDDFRRCRDAHAVASLYGPLDDRVYLVTGASSGFGLTMAAAIASAGGHVVMACRPGLKAEATAAEVRAAAVRSASVHLLPLELSSTVSVRQCAMQFEALRSQLPNGGALNALVLNAGIIGMPFGAFSPNEDPQLQVNLLGHALLHELLRPALEASSDARVVVVSSGSHYWITGPPDLNMDEELPPRAQNFRYYHSYGFSNLCRILWARALSKRVTYPVVSLHPACSPSTNAGRNMSISVLWSILPKVLYFEGRGIMEGQSVPQGARTQTFVAIASRDIVAPLSGLFISGNESDGPLGCPVAPSAFAQRDDYADKVMAFVDEFVAREKIESGLAW